MARIRSLVLTTLCATGALAATTPLARASPLDPTPALLEPPGPVQTGAPANRWEWFPHGLLHPRPLADLRRPAMSIRFRGSPGGHRPHLEGAVGGHWSFFHWHPTGRDDLGFEIAAFAGAFLDFATDDQFDLRSTDGVWGLTAAWRLGALSLKLEVFHLSAHKGDETIEALGEQRTDYRRDDAVIGFSWHVLPGWRLYGDVGYGLDVGGPAKELRWRWGAEFTAWHAVGPAWPLYAAIDFNSRQEVHYNVSFNVEAGLLIWSDGVARGCRAGLTWFRGKDPARQYFDRQAQWWGFSLTLDW